MTKQLLPSILLGVCFLTACQSGAEPSQDQETSNMVFKTLAVVQKDTFTENDYVCDIHSVNQVEIRSRVKGYIESVHTDEGQMVRKGQLLFRISSQEYREELLKAKAALKTVQAEAQSAEIEWRNAQNLVEKGVIAKTEADMAKTKLEAAKARIEEAQSAELSAQLRLSYTEIFAPFDGIIDRIPEKVGSLVDEGELITKLSDNSDVFAYFNVSEKEYINYMKGRNNQSSAQAVRLVLANNELFEETGRIETVDGQFDPETGTIAFRARFPNPKRLLKHGASGKVRLQQQRPNALIIPQKTSFDIQDKTFVYVLKADSTIEQRAIDIQARLPHLYLVEGGLKPQEQVLLEGVQLVKPGQKIKAEVYTIEAFMADMR